MLKTFRCRDWASGLRLHRPRCRTCGRSPHCTRANCRSQLRLTQSRGAVSDVNQILTDARSAHARGDLQAAAAGYGRTVEVDPANAELHYLLGTARYALGDVQGARASLQEAIRLN